MNRVHHAPKPNGRCGCPDEYSQSPVTEADVRGLIERADGVKMQRARERLEAVRAAAKAAQPEPETTAETEPEEG
jgi:hypothetical protein